VLRDDAADTGGAAKAGEVGFDSCGPCGMMIAEIVSGTVAVPCGTADVAVDGTLSDCGSKVNSGNRWDEVDVDVGAGILKVALAGCGMPGAAAAVVVGRNVGSVAGAAVASAVSTIGGSYIPARSSAQVAHSGSSARTCRGTASRGRNSSSTMMLPHQPRAAG
jgi:hypothetical protein